MRVLREDNRNLHPILHSDSHGSFYILYPQRLCLDPQLTHKSECNGASLATHPTFVSAGDDMSGDDAEDFDIHFIDKNLASLMPPPNATVAGRDVALAALAIVLRELPSADEASSGVSIWEGGSGAAGWRTNHLLRRVLKLHRSNGTSAEPVRPSFTLNCIHRLKKNSVATQMLFRGSSVNVNVRACTWM